MVALYGKVEEDLYGGELQLVQPQFEILGDSTDDGSSDGAEKKAAASLEVGRIVPIYESAGQGRLTSRWFRRIIHAALENLSPELPDAIPTIVRRRLSLISPRDALWRVHWPEAGESFEDLQTSRTPAHIRLIFEELFFIELGLELKRREQKAQTGIAFRLDDPVREAIKKILPVHPTAARKRVLKEIASDMEKPFPMRRLLQGDVGSGKTIVAFEAAIIAMENGFQVALMAPTEILAQQHYFSARRVLEPAGYRVVLLTGSLEDDRKRETRRHIAQGNAQLVIGTHALIEKKVDFANLGLVIVDEQHRFGVLQRFKLMKKNPSTGHVGTAAPGRPAERSSAIPAEPDVLVMTATPIPRTLALTLYGDLDIRVSTTVIEVGVDVANATIMVIEHAERFGLAQVHQLRGRIGRGAAKSYCILMTGGKVSEEGERRLDAMVRTNDGFKIAELDLELRGPGEFFGTRQAGLPRLRVANIIRDHQLLEAAKHEAASVLAGPNAEVSQEEISRSLVYMRTRWQKTYALVEVG